MQLTILNSTMSMGTLKTTDALSSTPIMPSLCPQESHGWGIVHACAFGAFSHLIAHSSVTVTRIEFCLFCVDSVVQRRFC